MVDEDTGQPVADGALHQRRGHRGIHAAGQPADRMAVADLRTHLLDQRIGDVGRRPLRAEPGEVVQEPAEHLLPVRGVHHLRVVLHPGQAPVPVLEGGHRGARGAGHHVESVRCGGDRVAVTHPDRLDLGQSRMQFAAKDFQFGAAVLAGAGVRDGPAERLRHGLKPVADPEHRHAEVEHRRIKLRGPVGVDTGRPAGEHERQRITGLDLLDRGGVRDDLRKNPCLPNPAGDQLRVLRTEIDHQHRPAGAACPSNQQVRPRRKFSGYQ